MACRIVTARRQQRQQKRNLKSIEEEEDESVKKNVFIQRQPTTQVSSDDADDADALEMIESSRRPMNNLRESVCEGSQRAPPLASYHVQHGRG